MRLRPYTFSGAGTTFPSCDSRYPETEVVFSRDVLQHRSSCPPDHLEDTGYLGAAVRPGLPSKDRLLLFYSVSHVLKLTDVLERAGAPGELRAPLLPHNSDSCGHLVMGCEGRYEPPALPGVVSKDFLVFFSSVSEICKPHI